MCGRYVSVRSDDDLLAEFDAEQEELREDDSVRAGDVPDYNVAPTKAVRVVVNRPPHGAKPAEGQPPAEPIRQLRWMSWGLVPSWSKDTKSAARFINARAESLASTPAFRRAYAARRCLVPADGWYEWKRDAGQKLPRYMHSADGHSLALAGLYEFWRNGEQWWSSCSIVTTDSVGELSEIHPRMPLVLGRADWSRWLDPAVAAPDELLRPADEARREQLQITPVSSAVNNVRHQGAELIQPVDEAGEQTTPQQLF